jgi:hypothetical protein
MAHYRSLDTGHFALKIRADERGTAIQDFHGSELRWARPAPRPAKFRQFAAVATTEVLSLSVI